jgi:hypothetical protein
MLHQHCLNLKGSKNMKSILAAVLAAGLISAGSASAAVVTLDFEGPASQASIDNFYGSLGVTFGLDALAFRNDIPEFPNFSNAPSPIGVMSPVGALSTMNVAPGFNGIASLYFSSADPGPVSIWSGLNGTGTQLGAFNLVNNTSACIDSPYCTWTLATFNLGANVAHSVTFGSAVGAGFDDVAVNTVPIPAALPLLAFGLGGMGAFLRRRKQAAV